MCVARTEPMLKTKARRGLALAFAIPLLAYGGAVGTVTVQQRSMLFKTADSGRLAAAAGMAIPNSQRLTLLASDGIETAAWYVPPQAGKPVFLFLHGQSGRLVIQKGRWRRLAAAGVGVLAVSYRGYPGSTGGPRSGTPSEIGIHRDALAAYTWLRGRHRAEDIVIHGHSLGTGVAVRLAAEVTARERIRAVILEAPFTAAVDLARERMALAPVDLLMWDQFRSRDRIARIRAPVLIAHGDRDSIIPYAHAERLYALAIQPKMLVRMAGSDHNTLVRDGLYEHVWPFIGLTLTAPAGPRAAN